MLTIALYVDDLLIACSDAGSLEKVKESLSSAFKMKDLNEAQQCLGFEIYRTRDSLHLSQQRYISSVLERFSMSDAKKVHTLMDANQYFTLEDTTSANVPYCEASGCLMYLTAGIRPDISFAVCRLAKFVEISTELHWKALKRLLRYLISTSGNGLQFRSECILEPVAYVDSDYAGDVLSRKSTSGGRFKMVGAAKTWCSRLQETVALSSTDAEYVSLTTATKEAAWLGRLLSGLNVEPILCTELTNVYTDNQGSMDLARNGSVNRGTKHIDLEFYFCRQALSDKNVEL